jgi:16S rRNA (guanine527-N7)-methyltransferase
VQKVLFLDADTTIDDLIHKGLEGSGLRFDQESAVRRLSFYATELEKWNRKINLTGKKTSEQIVKELMYDAFFLYPYVKGKRSILDMGSGAGVIGLPLAILDRTLRVVSVDANTKKIQFQRHVKRSLALENLTLFATRIENLEPQEVGVVVAKAFGSTEDVLTKAGRHIEIEGRIMLMKGKTEPERDFDPFLLETSVRYHYPGSAKEFKLLTYKKVP